MPALHLSVDIPELDGANPVGSAPSGQPATFTVTEDESSATPLRRMIDEECSCLSPGGDRGPGGHLLPVTRSVARPR